MLLNKKHLLGFSFLLFFVTSCMADKLHEQSWWLNLSISPSQSMLDGIPISKFNKSWKYAVYLDSKLINQHVSNTQLRELENSKFQLSLSSDLNKNHINETIKVGVFQKANGKKGIFLTILENSKPLKVFTDSTNEGFSALIEVNDTINWYKCMNCNTFESISWNGKSYILK